MTVRTRRKVPVVVLDANVLYPAQLRDFLMRLAVEGIIRAHWTEYIHQEWMRAVRKRLPDIRPEQLERTRELMDRALPDALIHDYLHLASLIQLPDPDDLHVAAAALAVRADAILTFNQKDFPRSSLAPHRLRAIHPDRFAAGLYRKQPQEVAATAHQHRLSLRNPALSAEEYLATLARAGLTETTSLLRRHLDML